MSNIVFLGPPLAGKGTQAKMISMFLDVPHLATGDMFRVEIASGSELGKTVKAIIESGRLVDDEITIKLVSKYLSKDGFVLDGFPRTIAQAKALSKIVKIDKVIYFKIEKEALLSRLQGRQVCPKCGAAYHNVSIPSKVAGICDLCGETLIKRKDDDVSVLDTRLEAYFKLTHPLIDFYKELGILIEVDASLEISGVYDELTRILDDSH